MAKNGFKAIDSDLHVLEPADLWERYTRLVPTRCNETVSVSECWDSRGNPVSIRVDHSPKSSRKPGTGTAESAERPVLSLKFTYHVRPPYWSLRHRGDFAGLRDCPPNRSLHPPTAA